MIFLLSELFIDESPYKYSFDWVSRWFKRTLCKISFTLLIRAALWVTLEGHVNKTLFVSSTPWLQWHISGGVPIKLWQHLWPLNGLKLTLNWKRNRRPTGSKILKILLDSGRIRDKISFLRIPREGTSLYLKISIKIFQEAMASGKTLFLYLFDLQKKSWKVLRMFPLKISLQFGGSLSFRYDRVLLLIILWTWIARLNLRRSDRVSQPNSSYSLMRLDPCQAPVIARAAWCWILSTFVIRELRVTIIKMWAYKSLIHLIKRLKG